MSIKTHPSNINEFLQYTLYSGYFWAQNIWRRYYGSQAWNSELYQRSTPWWSGGTEGKRTSAARTTTLLAAQDLSLLMDYHLLGQAVRAVVWQGSFISIREKWSLWTQTHFQLSFFFAEKCGEKLQSEIRPCLHARKSEYMM